MQDKLRRQNAGESDVFVDPNACRAYAGAARTRLEQRIAQESAASPTHAELQRRVDGSDNAPAGEVAERSNAAVLKTVSPQGLGGSNPSLSAIWLALSAFMVS